MNLGYIFTFILTAFTTIATILPSLTQSSENNNPEIYRFQALYTLLNRSSSTGNILSANITLHQVRDVQNQTAKMLNYIKAHHKPYEELLSYAAMNYNINQTAPAENFISHTQCKTPDCSQKVWYFRRLLDINKPNNNNVVHEDRECIKTNWTCTQKELADIHNNISSLSQSGYSLQFYNDRSAVDSLEKPLAIFVRDLHSLIIISFIIVFIVVLTMRGEKVSRLFTR